MQARGQILIAAEDSDDRAFYRRCLERGRHAHYEFLSAASGAQACSVLRRRSPNCLLMDCQFPDMSGSDLLNSLARMDILSGTYVIALVSAQDRDQVQNVLQAGAADWIFKPGINGNSLTSAVQPAFETSPQADSQPRHLRSSADAHCNTVSREAYASMLKRHAIRAVEADIPLSLLLADVDYLQPYYDYFGRLAGESRLQDLICSMGFLSERPAELLSKFSGGKFALILPGLGYEAAAEHGQRLVDFVRGLQIPHPGSPISQFLTISVGLATSPKDWDADGQALFAVAQRALVNAKQTGRDRLGRPGDISGLEFPSRVRVA